MKKLRVEGEQGRKTKEGQEDGKILRCRRLLIRNPALLQVSDRLYRRLKEEGGGMAFGRIAIVYVMAPVLCLYVAWVLRSALASGKKRLYFLARDGYSMYQVASVLCDKLHIPMECRYLHCSRYAWRSALYWLLGKEALDYVCLGGMGVTFRKICARAGLTEEEAFWAAHLLRRDESMDKTLEPGALKKLREELADCKFFWDRMAKHSRSVYPQVCGYLEQEGLLESIPWALVDSGWTGSMQKSLRQLLTSMGYQGEVEGYYFGMYEFPKDMSPEGYHSWYFGPENGIWRKVFFSNSLFECILSAEEGMTAGYCFRQGRLCPVFEKEWNPNREKIRVSTEILKAYAGEFAEWWKKSGILFGDGEHRTSGHPAKAKHSAKPAKPGEAAKPAKAEHLEKPAKPKEAADRYAVRMAFRLLRSFMAKPSLAEAEYFGSYIFCDDVIGEGSGWVAARLTSSQIKGNRLLHKAAALWRKRGEMAEESAWLEGSIRLAGMGDGELWHCAVYKYILYMRKRILGRFKGFRRTGTKKQRARRFG